MSKRDSNERDVPGYFLPEDSQLRLAKLGDHIRFLSRLAQPRTLDEEQESLPEVRMGELAICLGLLAEQIEFVLEEVSWPARQASMAKTPEPDAEPTSAPEAPDGAGGSFAFGVTLDQVDKLDRLIQTISAHGHRMATGQVAELADHTLPLLAQAIQDGAAALRDVLDQVETQRLAQRPRSRGEVGEERGGYGAGPMWPVADSRPVRHRRGKKWAVLFPGRSSLHSRRWGFRSPCRRRTGSRTGARRGVRRTDTR